MDLIRRLARRLEKLAGAYPLSWTATAVILLLVGGFLLRWHNYTHDPALGSNGDEIAWAWLGQSLILHHWPASWSYLHEGLPLSVMRTSYGVNLPYVSPFFDAPPLFGILVGYVALHFGQTTPQSVTAEYIRFVPMVLSILTAWLLYRVAERYLNRATALIALALFCLTPWMVEAGRLVQSEWLLAPMALGVLVLAGNRSFGATTVLLALCVLAPLVKVTGVIVGVAACIALLTERRWLVAGFALVSAPIGVGLFAAYGALVDWHQFLVTWHVQAARHTSPIAGRFFIFAGEAGLWNFVPLNDPFWVVGMLGLASMTVGRSPGRHLRIPFTFAAYAVLMTVTASTEGAEYYGWYRFTVDPLCYIGAGYLISQNIPWLPWVQRRWAKLTRTAPVEAVAEAG